MEEELKVIEETTFDIKNALNTQDKVKDEANSVHNQLQLLTDRQNARIEKLEEELRDNREKNDEVLEEYDRVEREIEENERKLEEWEDRLEVAKLEVMELEPKEIKTLNDLKSCQATDMSSRLDDEKLEQRIDLETVKKDNKIDEADMLEHRARRKEEDLEKLYEDRDEIKELYRIKKYELDNLMTELPECQRKALRNRSSAKNQEADDVEDTLERVNQKIYEIEEDVSKDIFDHGFTQGP